MSTSTQVVPAGTSRPLTPMSMDTTAPIGATSTYGSALGNLFEDVNKVVQSAISRAEQAGLNILLNASQQLELTIEGVRNAYRSEENKPVDRASKAAQDALTQIDAMVKELQSGAQDQLEALSGRSVIFLQGLPFASNQPKVLSIGPTNLILRAGQINTLTITGGFPQASTDEDFRPRLHIGGVECPLVGNTDKKLIFQIYSSLIEERDPHKYTHLPSAMLTIPWNDGWFSNPWRMVNAMYRIGLNILPATPARIVAQVIGTTPRRVTSGIIESAFISAWGGNCTENITCTVRPKNPNWQIDTTVQPVPRATKILNNASARIASVTPEAITLLVHVNSHGVSGGKNGVWEGVVQYQEVHTYVENSVRPIDYSSMTWGESRIVEMLANEQLTNVSIDNYLGQHTETGAAAYVQGPVHLTPIGGGQQWRLEIVPPST